MNEERFARNEERFARNEERFARTEHAIDRLIAAQARTDEKLQALIDAIRQKDIGRLVRLIKHVLTSHDLNPS